MLDYLLAEKNFVSLKRYIDFLNALGPTLSEIKRFSDSFARQGHTLLTPPDAQELAIAASACSLGWQRIKTTIPALGTATDRVLTDIDVFIREFRAINDAGWDRQSPITHIDPQRFSLVKPDNWTGPPPVDVIDIMKLLWDRLGLCERSVLQLKAEVRDITEKTHSIFVRFVESLRLPLCSCDGPVSKIEAYYVLGHLGLPGMQYEPGESHYEEQRRAKANEHIARLFGLYWHSSGAANNLGDFCHRLQRFLGDAKRELASNHPAQTLPRAKTSLGVVGYSLIEVRDMSSQLVAMAKKLNA